MRKIIFVTLGLALLFFVSCKTSEKIALAPSKPEQQARQIPPTKWMQNTYPAISPDDPITFFNEFEINIEASIPKKVLMFQDGTTYYVDSSIVLSYKITKLTPGVLINAKKQNGLPMVMDISFSENDPNYNVSFFVYKDKSFVQDANSVILYDGKKYKALATISGDNSGLNHLLSNFDFINSVTKIDGTASGRNAVGTKIIEIK